MQALMRRGPFDGEGAAESTAEEDSATRNTLDLRGSGDRPVDTVFDALENCSEDEGLLVLTTAAPIPLYDRLEERGWSYEAVRSDVDEWRIHVTAGGEGRSGERLRRPRRRGHE